MVCNEYSLTIEDLDTVNNPEVCDNKCIKYLFCKRVKTGKFIPAGFMVKAAVKQNTFRTYKSDAIKIKGKLSNQRKTALNIAYDLCYDNRCKDEIILAKTEGDIERALIGGRIRRGD